MILIFKPKKILYKRTTMETNLEDLDLGQFLAEMGLTNNNDIKAPLSTGNEDIFEEELEDYLLSNYSKTKIENLFISINNYTNMCKDFEDLFITNTNEINIELMNEAWSLEQIVLYFNQFTNVCLDHINSLCNLLNYVKDKNFEKFKERILTSYKVFNPTCLAKIEAEAIIDILQVLRNIQAEFLNGIGYFAYINNLPIKTIEDRTIALLKYNEEIKTLNKDSFFNLKTNNSIIDLKKRVSLIAINLINDNSISPYIELKLDSESMKTNLNKLMDLYSEFENKCIVLQNFISEDKSFSYEKAKLAYKATSFGSTEEYLKDLNNNVNSLFSIVRSIFELIILDKQKDTNNTNEILEENGFDIEDFDHLEDIYNYLLECVEGVVSDFVMFCKQKQINWNTEIDIKKANNKFLKKIEKHNYYKLEKRPERKKQIILKKLQEENIK